MDTKKDIRKKAIRDRNCLSAVEIALKSKTIEKKLTALKAYQESKTIMFYASYNNEVKTDGMIETALCSGKSVCLPVAIKEEKRLKIKRILNLSELKTGNYGIREPKIDLPDVTLEEVNLVLVPGCCFDEKGFRLGYGGGFYDRFISDLGNKVVKVGLAFQIQIVDSLPCEEHDQPIDVLITENNVYDFST